MKFWFQLRERTRHLLRRGLDRIRVPRGMVAPWAEEETLFPLETRAGAGFFAFLFLISLPQAGTWRLYGMDAGAFFDRIHYAADARLFLYEGGILLTALAMGIVLGAAVRGAWILCGDMFPRAERKRFSPAFRTVVSLTAVAFLHLGVLTHDIFRRPSLYQEAFVARAAWLREFQIWAVEGGSGWLRWAGVIWGVLLLSAAAVNVGKLLFQRFRKWAHPRRLAVVVLGGGLAAVSLGVWSVHRLHAPRNAGPNVLLLIVTGLRSDLLPPEGSATFPRLSALAAESRVYAACYPPVPQTSPALMTLVTGRSPLRHGVRHSFPSSDLLRPGTDNLISILRQNGYTTAALTDAGGDFFSRMGDLFHTVRGADRSLPRLLQERVLRRHCHLFPYLTRRPLRALFPVLRNFPELTPPARLARETDARLRRLRSREKFFLAVHVSALEAPFAGAPPPGGSAYTGPHRYAFSPSHAEEGISESDKERIRLLYQTNARAVDAAVGRILDSLKNRRLEENTIVLAWSPFGEQLFERGLGLGHGGHLFGRETLAAPLIIRVPRKRIPPRRVEEAVRAQDVAPTVLSLLGIGVPDGMDGFPLEQREFGEPAEEFFGVYAETEWPSFVSGGTDPANMKTRALGQLLEIDLWAPSHLRVNAAWEDHILLRKHRMIQIGAERLVYTPTQKESVYRLFQLEEDPDGMADAAGSRKNAERVRELKDALYRFMARESGWHPQNGYWIPEAFLREPAGFKIDAPED